MAARSTRSAPPPRRSTTRRASTGAPASAAGYEKLHASAVLSEQQSHSDGSTYGANTTSYTYVGREEHTAQLAAQLFLTEYVRDHNLFSFTNNNYWLAP